MIEGVVQPPGVFLNASAVLERQFTAFCFDTWVARGISPSMLPNKLSFVLSNVKSKNQDRFPYTFIKFIENHGTELLANFIKIFSKACSSGPDAEISPESCEHLKRFLDGDGESSGSLRYQIMNGLISTLKEKEAFERQVGTLRERIKKKESNPVKDLNYEEELRLLRREKNGIQQLIQTLVEKNVFNFFTDEGLIPNYSFPEAGVTLHSIIYRKNEKTSAGRGTFETAAFDYVRPAAAAIAELAPSSTFYAGGRHVKVDQVEVSLSPVEQWRFCDNCDHSELIGVKEERSSCLRCGSTMWSDKGQERPMIRLRQVFATSNDSMSRISDDDDDREPSFYNRAMMVDFEDVNITDAWHLTCEDLPFGFEFLSKATFRDINFAERGEFGEKVKIAGVDITRRGFIICRYCGNVQTPGDAPEHTFTCKARKPKAEGNFTDCVYLYREFDSEAIRILLPVTTFSGSKDKLHSFIAALHLGLKKTFRGNIDHLQTMVCDEPVPGSPYRKQYLVLYDTVPGGTGYLKQLMLLSSPLLDVLHVAREHLASCACVLDSDRDGCYSCLYAYRHSHEMKETSRSTGVALLSEILTHRGHLAKIDTLRNVNMNSIIESELEARFLEALRRMKCGNKPVTITKELVNCKPGYLLTVSERAYYIEPQVHLGPADGVAIHSRADSLIRPARIQDKGRPIAIFTDGYFITVTG